MSSLDTLPSIRKSSFACPHCSAYASQKWYGAIADQHVNDQHKNTTPIFPNQENIDNWKKQLKPNDTQSEHLVELIEWGQKILAGELFFEATNKTMYNYTTIQNVNFSECYVCGKLSIWHKDAIIYPEVRIEIKPNPDLNAEIISLFDEARLIVNHSPKGAAALLRLCLQLLCKQLGEPGKHIDTDITSLVKKGLSPEIQMALDYVRVVGNESVHPGSINLNDNKDISLHLFNLINLICDQMISQPKKVKEMYNLLPPEKLKAIEERNKKATS